MNAAYAFGYPNNYRERYVYIESVWDSNLVKGQTPFLSCCPIFSILLDPPAWPPGSGQRTCVTSRDQSSRVCSTWSAQSPSRLPGGSSAYLVSLPPALTIPAGLGIRLVYFLAWVCGSVEGGSLSRFVWVCPAFSTKNPVPGETHSVLGNPG